MTIAVPQYILKASDTARTATTTIAADPHLAVKLVAGIPYDMEIGIWFATAGAIPGMKIRTFIENSDLDLANSTFASTMIWNSATLAMTHDRNFWGFFADLALAFVAGTEHYVLFKGILKASVTQTYQFGWAQNTSDAAATTIKARSYIRATPHR